MLTGVSTLNANCVVQAVQTGNERRFSLPLAVFGYFWHITGVSNLIVNCMVQAVQTVDERREGSTAAAHQPWG